MEKPMAAIDSEPSDQQEIDMAATLKIKSITPANGWYVVYDDYDEGQPKEKAVAVPVACFAVVENRHGDGWDDVVPMSSTLDAGLELADESKNYICCVHESQLGQIQEMADELRGRKK